MSFFSQVKQNFVEVPEDGQIVTETFLDACSEIVPFFDVLGATAFAPVKADLNGNITKLRNKFLTNPIQFNTLQGIVNIEIEAKTTKAKNSATDALLWLKRALSFIRVFFEEVLKMEEDLSKCVNAAYEGSLKQFHGWMVKKIFSLAMMAVPYRKDFIIALGKDIPEQQVLDEMKAALELMAANLDKINEFYQQTGQERSDKV